MKKITFTFGIFLIFIFNSIGQINPVNNLTWEQTYYFGNYTFGLSWNQPDLPHDELIGYNIYRDNEFFRFQTQSYLTNMGANPNCGQEFMNFPSNGDGFDIHITAVYNPGGTESNYTQTVFSQNNLLNNNNFEKPKTIFYPNPTRGIINIKCENLIKILIYDNLGKKIKEFEPKPQIDLSDISKGIYIIKLISDNEIFMNKVVIE
jgi:hypothetical protein